MVSGKECPITMEEEYLRHEELKGERNLLFHQSLDSKPELYLQLEGGGAE